MDSGTGSLDNVHSAVSSHPGPHCLLPGSLGAGVKDIHAILEPKSQGPPVPGVCPTEPDL